MRLQIVNNKNKPYIMVFLKVFERLHRENNNKF